MSSVLMTSTMKSEPLRDSVSGVPSGSTFSFGGPGGTLETRAGAPGALALVAAARPTAGPAASAPARNWRRFILGCFDMALLLGALHANLPPHAGKSKRKDINKAYRPSRQAACGKVNSPLLGWACPQF